MLSLLIFQWTAVVMIGWELKEVWWRGNCSSSREVKRGVSSLYFFPWYHLNMDYCSSVVPLCLKYTKCCWEEKCIIEGSLNLFLKPYSQKWKTRGYSHFILLFYDLFFCGLFPLHSRDVHWHPSLPFRRLSVEYCKALVWWRSYEASALHCNEYVKIVLTPLASLLMLFQVVHPLYYWDLLLTCCTRDFSITFHSWYWDSGILCPLSAVLNRILCFGKWICFCSEVRSWGGSIQLHSLE